MLTLKMFPTMMRTSNSTHFAKRTEKWCLRQFHTRPRWVIKPNGKRIQWIKIQSSSTVWSEHRLIGCAGSFRERLIGGHCGILLANWRSLIWYPTQWVSRCYTIDYYRSVIVLCSVLCLYGSCEIQFRTKSFHLWLLRGKKTHINHAGENFTLHFPTQQVCMEMM
jgi:hypothetical protein